MAVVEAQKSDPRHVAYIDVENKIDESWADAWGVDRNRWRKFVPHAAEDTADSVKSFLSSGAFSLVVIDSVGAMISKVEMEKDAGDAVMAKVAQISSRMVKIANAYANENNAAVIIINQLRANLSGFGGPTQRAGGWVLKYGTSGRFYMKATDKKPLTAVVNSFPDIPVAHERAIKVERNKCFAPGAVANVLFHTLGSPHGPIGVDRAQEFANVGVRLGVIARGGAYYTLPSGEKFQGEEALRAHLRSSVEDMEAVRKACLALKVEAVVDDTKVAEEAADLGYEGLQEAQEAFRARTAPSRSLLTPGVPPAPTEAPERVPEHVPSFIPPYEEVSYGIGDA